MGCLVLPYLAYNLGLTTRPRPEPIIKEVKVYITKEQEKCEKMGGVIRFKSAKYINHIGWELNDWVCVTPEKVLLESN